MVERKVYVTKIVHNRKNEAKQFFMNHPIGKDIVMSVFSYENMVMIYMEDHDGSLSAEALFGEPRFLEDVGMENGKYARMEDIFHYNRPKDEEHWIRSTTETQPKATFAKIQFGKLSSYMHYHYLLQENTDKEREKYGAIYVLENYLFFYRELPVEIEKPWYQSKAKGDIPVNWHEVMNEHFVFWPDLNTPWRGMDKWR